jgi:hypothetical protein
MTIMIPDVSLIFFFEAGFFEIVEQDIPFKNKKIATVPRTIERTQKNRDAIK